MIVWWDIIAIKKSKLENVNYKQYFENRLLEVKSSFFERISELDSVDINVEDKYQWINITGTFIDVDFIVARL